MGTRRSLGSGSIRNRGLHRHVASVAGTAAIETRCSLVEAPRTTADTATFALDAVGTTREACGLTLAARALRPWPTASNGPWTILLTVSAEEVTARRLESEEARDAIDAGRTLLVTDDVDLVAYAAARADLEVAPLPWDRTYVGLYPDSALSLGAMVGPDAVRADAREANPLICDSLSSGDGERTEPRSDAFLLRRRSHGPRARRADRRAGGEPGCDRRRSRLGGARGLAPRGGRTRLHRLGAASLPVRCTRHPGPARVLDHLGAIHPLIDTRAHTIVSRTSRP